MWPIDGNRAALLALLQADPHAAADDGSLLQLACEKGYLDLAAALLSHGGVLGPARRRGDPRRYMPRQRLATATAARASRRPPLRPAGAGRRAERVARALGTQGRERLAETDAAPKSS